MLLARLVAELDGLAAERVARAHQQHRQLLFAESHGIAQASASIAA
jgi:hypothetical protein